MGDINEYIESLLHSRPWGEQVVFHRLLPAKNPRWDEPVKPFPGPVARMLADMGIKTLYSHQTEAINTIRGGKDTVVCTPTASGKTLIYNLPFFEKVTENPAAKALYLFPLKALAQDQLKTIHHMASLFPHAAVSACVYDGDTTARERKKVRQSPPNAILTNPDMLHLSLLPYHESWAGFYADLELVIVDEVHTYRGIMGSHMAQVFRRFMRIARFHGADPTFVFCSATVANPGELAGQLTGLGVQEIRKSGAPAGKKHLVFVNPDNNPSTAAIQLLKAAVHRKIRTIVYTQSRKMAELISMWAGSGRFSDKISPYRAGYLPEERRDIEQKLSSKALLAVISTSALELGIDIGDLELCILVGYPGTIVSALQRGGRVGRSGQDSALVMIAGEDALDQYFIRNPEEFLTRPPESAVINPENPEILSRHLVCAAHEISLCENEPLMNSKNVKDAVFQLEQKGELLRTADGKELVTGRRFPQRDIDLRGTGTRYTLVDSQTGENRGEVDDFRAFRETHPHAVYLHLGKTYIVEHLDINGKIIRVRNDRVGYYTRVRTRKDTDILEVEKQKKLFNTNVYMGRLRVTDQVTGYEKWRIRANRKLGIYPLDLPAQVFETQGIWIVIPKYVQQACEKQLLHFMGGIHAIEHAAIGIFPLLVLADRNDLGGISTTQHPDIQMPAVFIYDGVAGGAGLTRKAFYEAEKLLSHTFSVINDCPCETGCPSCVHSPKCGSGNRPINKEAARFILEALMQEKTSNLPEMVGEKVLPFGGNENGYSLLPAANESITLLDSMERENKGRVIPDVKKQQEIPCRYVVFDIETQLSHAEVGGWHRADRMRVSVAVLYEAKTNTFMEFQEDRVEEMIKHMQEADLVIGFNSRRFDYRVLSGYSDFRFSTLPTLDLLEDVQKRLGYRLSLDHLCRVTLGAKKSANGLMALQWWKEGKIEEIVKYCKKDVALTRDLYRFGKKNGYLLFENKAKKTVRVPVSW